ncbi:alpha/beta fold hydrolase [Halovivax gelatinilyticus]|uniref:alpha/beta fold hydrolase n=1 Tax=Halovivax gelatinilyticus TaxID=2961597 RepID=UPI0020CA4C06|nr:alpha/beta hydrolase [Halovivax gelatinilyticus]
MPTASSGDVTLFYEAAGDGPTVVFVPDAGLGGWSWGWQHAAVAGPYRSVVWDLRGTGRSDRPAGPYAMDQLAGDLRAILAAVDARRAHVVGAGLGGAIALRAARNATRIGSLTLLGTGVRGADFDLDPLFAPPDDPDVIEARTRSLLSEAFLAEQPDVLDGIIEWRSDGDATSAGFDAQVAALEPFDATEWGYGVTIPVTIYHGADDALVPPDSGRALADALPRGELRPIDGGHLAYVERSRAVNDLLLGDLAARFDE